MGKVKKSRSALLIEKGLDKESILTEKILNSDLVNAEQVRMFNEARNEYKSGDVEDPIFILENKELMRYRLEYYIELMQHTIRNNDDSISETDAVKLLDNKYVEYIRCMLNN